MMSWWMLVQLSSVILCSKLDISSTVYFLGYVHILSDPICLHLILPIKSIGVSMIHSYNRSHTVCWEASVFIVFSKYLADFFKTKVSCTIPTCQYANFLHRNSKNHKWRWDTLVRVKSHITIFWPYHYYMNDMCHSSNSQHMRVQSTGCLLHNGLCFCPCCLFCG